jgi:hypothetical protein
MIAAPVGVEVNGYPVPVGVLANNSKNSLFALGGTAGDIRFRTLVSYFPSEIASLLAEMKQMLGGVPLEFVPLASAYREALVNGLHVREALLIDIGGASTMLVMLKGGFIVQALSFPFGVFHIAQELGEKSALPLEEVLDQLRQYSQGHRDKKMQSTLSQHLGPAIEIWSQCFRDNLDFLYPMGPLTGETYLCGGGAYIPELRSYVEHGEWLKNLSYASAPRVSIFDGKSLFSENQFQGFFQGPEDAGLASVTRYGMHHEIFI